LPEDVVIVAPLPQAGMTVARRLLEVLNKADEGCIVSSGYEEVDVSRHEAVRNDLNRIAGGARHQALDAGGNEAPVLKPCQPGTSLENQVIGVGPLVAEGVKSRR
jgi:hypothetical protein